MRDQLPKFLRPTNDMRKAIDRNAKQDKDLFSFTKQLDKERKMVIEQLSMKKDNFKKEMIKRRESLSNLKARLSNDVADTGQPRPGANNLAEMRLRRAFSVGDIRSPSSICQLPHLINKRHSHPSSPVPVVSRDLSDKTGGLKRKSPRRKNATITCDFNIINGQLEMEEKSRNDDCIDIHVHHKTRCLEMMSPRRKNATITCDFQIANGQLAVEEKSANDHCKDIHLGPCRVNLKTVAKFKILFEDTRQSRPQICGTESRCRHEELPYLVCLPVTHALRFLRCRIRN